MLARSIAEVAVERGDPPDQGCAALAPRGREAERVGRPAIQLSGLHLAPRAAFPLAEVQLPQAPIDERLAPRARGNGFRQRAAAPRGAGPDSGASERSQSFEHTGNVRGGRPGERHVQSAVAHAVRHQRSGMADQREQHAA